MFKGCHTKGRLNAKSAFHSIQMYKPNDPNYIPEHTSTQKNLSCNQNKIIANLVSIQFIPGLGYEE